MVSVFEKALQVEVEELKGTLQWEDPEQFVRMVWQEMNKSLPVEYDVFRDKVYKELRERNRDIREFRSKKGEPITNLFKRVFREISKKEGISLSNDVLSRLINFVRQQYCDEGYLYAGLFPLRAFLDREEFSIPYDLGDTKSCFLEGKGNYGNVLWLRYEDEVKRRAKFVVFVYEKLGNTGIGRCWVYQISPHVIYLTNFYSKGIDLKATWLKYSVVRLLRRMYGIGEGVKFVQRNIALPIHQNEDGLLIYEGDDINSDAIAEKVRRLTSICMRCGKEVEMIRLHRYENGIRYQGERVFGLVMCTDCIGSMSTYCPCDDCGRMFPQYTMYFVNGVYYCEDCYRRNSFVCEQCYRVCHVSERRIDSYGHHLCGYCTVGYRCSCSMCNSLYRPADLTPVHILKYGLHLEECVVCSDCYSRLVKIVCSECAQIYYVRKDYLNASEMIRRIVKSGLCPKCYMYKSALKEQVR